MNKTIIELTPADALLFIEYQKRYAFMKLLESVGAFSVKNGSITIHFDSMGTIASVDKAEHYRPQRDQLL